jgi:hypothetical protein
LHDVLHAPKALTHRYGEQLNGMRSALEHSAPGPEHVAAMAPWIPSWKHSCGEQTDPAEASTHVPSPEHVVLHALSSPQPLFRSRKPAGTGSHFPSLPGTMHE